LSNGRAVVLRRGLGEAGSRHAGTIDLPHPKLPLGLKVRENKEPWHGGPIRITCHARDGTCPRSLVFTKEFELLGLPEARGGETISFPTTLFCVPGGKETHEDLELKFDRHGNLERRKSHLGKL
jgi:hypothetical protein